MAKELIKLNAVYWLLALKYEWIYDNVNLENHYKVRGYELKQVIIKEQYKSNNKDITYAVCGVINQCKQCEIVRADTYIGYKEFVIHTDNLLFFHTKKEAIDIVLSFREEIESFTREAVERSREVVMKKIKAMNNLKVKLDTLEKQRLKLP